LPPYSQDLSDTGKRPSDGWSFSNSFCTERYVGGIEKGRPPYEAGCSAKDTDYMHVINWKKAAELVAAGKATKINGDNVLPLAVSIKAGKFESKDPCGLPVINMKDAPSTTSSLAWPTLRCMLTRRSPSGTTAKARSSTRSACTATSVT